MLKMFEPTTFPTAISRWPRQAARTDVATSGSDVPAATIVRPMTSSETPNDRANATAPPTSQRAPRTSIPSPARTRRRFAHQEPVGPSGISSAVSTRLAALSFRLWSTEKPV